MGCGIYSALINKLYNSKHGRLKERNRRIVLQGAACKECEGIDLKVKYNTFKIFL